MAALLRIYRHLSDKRYSTIAGTLVYFLIMGMAPTLFLIALIAGRIDLMSLLPQAVVQAIGPFLSYLGEAAGQAASGAGIVLLITSLYSSTNFFYHLRRSGEIIYGSVRSGGGVRLRFKCAGAVLASVLMCAAGSAVLVACAAFLSRMLPKFAATAVRLIAAAALLLGAALALNKFACPYRTEAGSFLPGSLLTAALWLVFAQGFALYMSFADFSRLYGAADFAYKLGIAKCNGGPFRPAVKAQRGLARARAYEALVQSHLFKHV